MARSEREMRYVNDIELLLHEDWLHAFYFTYKGERFILSGWWMLTWGEFSDECVKYYKTKEEFMKDRLFEGKTILDIKNELEDIDWDEDPH